MRLQLLDSEDSTFVVHLAGRKDGFIHYPRRFYPLDISITYTSDPTVWWAKLEKIFHIFPFS